MSNLKMKKELFLRRQREKGVKQSKGITPRSSNINIPVSFVQETALKGAMDLLYDPEETRTSCPYLGYTIKGRLDITALNKTFNEIVRRHEVLRTNYKVIKNKLYQEINEASDITINIVDLDSLLEADKKEESERIIFKRATDTFHFFDDSVMIRAMLILGGNEHILYITIDHIASDGWSMGVLKKELFSLYEAFSKNKPPPLQELPIQFADYALWERNRFSGDFLSKRLDYWRRVSKNKKTALPSDRISPSICFDGSVVPVLINADLKKQLQLLSKKNDTTLFTILLAALTVLTYSFSGYSYNFFSIPVSNRQRKETESLIACLMDFQYALIDVKDNSTFWDIIKITKKALNDSYDNYIPCNFLLKDIMSVQDPLVDFQFQALDGLMPNIDATAKETGNKPISKVPDIALVSNDLKSGQTLREADTGAATKNTEIKQAPKNTVTGLVLKTEYINKTSGITGISASSKKTGREQTPINPEFGSLQNNSKDRSISRDIKFIPHKIPQPIFALHEISLNLNEMFGQISGNFIYQSSLYDHSTIVNLKNDFISILKSVAEDPDIKISELKIKPHKSIAL